MAAVKGQQIDSYLKSLPPKHRAALIFGTDPGAVSDRAAQLSKALSTASNPPGEILRLDEADLEQNPDRLAIELRTVSMFGGPPVVRVSNSRRVNGAMISALLTGVPLEGYLIVEAQNLKPDDALRALFEKSDTAVAVACYPDEARDLDSLVSDVLNARRMTMTADARRLLVSRLGADRSLSRNEIEKLALYALNSVEITETDVDAIIGDASELAIDKVITAVASGNATEALLECDRLLTSGESPQTVIILTQRYFQRLHRIRSGLDAGGSLDAIIRALRPPLHFKLKNEIGAQVRDWTMPKLTRALARISDAQRASRGGSMSEELVTEQLLLDLSRLAAIRQK